MNELSIEDKKKLIASLEKRLEKPLALLEETGEFANKIRPVIVKIQKNDYENLTKAEIEEAQGNLYEILKRYDSISNNDFSEINHLMRLRSEVYGSD